MTLEIMQLPVRVAGFRFWLVARRIRGRLYYAIGEWPAQPAGDC
jgi:hypothetical protein